MEGNLICWKCGDTLGDTPLPLSRYARCRGCGTELYVCRMCRHFDPQLTIGCREERADDVRARESANFCDWFSIRTDAWEAGGAQAPSGELAVLFGGGDAAAAQADEADEARRALEALFGK